MGITINGTINIVKTGQLKQTALWMVDSDADGVPSSTTQTAQSTSPGSTYRRRNLETTLGANVSNLAADCNDSSANVYRSDVSTATDADQDGYYTGSLTTNCVGDSSTVSGRTYYKTTGGAFTWLASGSALGGSDCNDADATKYQNLTGYTDADGDGFGTTTPGTVCSGASLPAGYVSNNTDCNDGNSNVYQNVASTATDADQDGYYTGASGTNCVGASTAVSGRTYYKATGGSYTWLATAGALGTTDCYDSNANAHPGQTSYFTTNRGDGSYDYDCNGTNDLNPAALTNTYVTPGTYTWTATGVTTISTLQLLGAGGGGGTPCWGSGSGGGGGGYSTYTNLSIVSGNSYSIVVGARGLGGSHNSNCDLTGGSNGGNSTAFNAVGSGGAGAPPSNSANFPNPGAGGGGGSGTHTGGQGGGDACGTGYPYYGAGGGSGAWTSSNGNAGHDANTDSSGGCPANGDSLGGASVGAGAGGNGEIGTGQNGSDPGGGGGGGGGTNIPTCCTFGAGGNGGAGYVTFTYSSTDCSVQSCR